MIHYLKIHDKKKIMLLQGCLEFFTGLGSALGPVIGGGLYSVSVHTIMFKILK